ncbi:5'-nucleotidase, lipoprotein e(P4) family [Vibrio sp. S4M6]|uniref:5'-nucleotidase, lipoprotein e(P4) family n=1 Tax=Vibrio sinus TaxID=2946865 RepID=UPI00202A11B7|nr:5'-nucleotidase, lipoprotein e(P4) family [Vibrio sinus]MCL9783981.1 5'-nucleotidase, lipoprotein e(P4) family [Vibrio sinus]
MKTKTLAVLATAIIAATSWQASAKEQTVTNAQLADQATLAVDWTQQSGEYRALAYQAFNVARMSFDKIRQEAKENGSKEKLAVVVDLDETMINNSAYAAWQIKHGTSFSPKTWSEWVHSEESRAIPGAVAFSKYIDSHGGTVFYVSNRSEKNLKPTMANLKKLGFANVTDKTVLLKTTTSDKKPRREKIMGEGYKIVMLLGDNLNDLDSKVIGKSNKIRREHVDAEKALYGVKYIVLPNPTYGGWEAGMAKDYYQLNNAGKSKLRHDVLYSWNGK